MKVLVSRVRVIDTVGFLSFPLSFTQTTILLIPRTQASSQQLQLRFSEHFFAPKLAALFVTPIISATMEQIWREKMSEKDDAKV